jgi:deferrochelatase/peroxidase EfeB
MPDLECQGAGPPPVGEPAPPGLWAGVDTAPAPHVAVVQADLPDGGVDACAGILETVASRLRGRGFAAGFGPAQPPPTYLLGFSARLLKGPWTPWRDDSDDSPRWGRPVRCPASLRLMDAKRDTEFPAFGTDAQRVAHETDLIGLLESADEALLSQAVDAVGGVLGGDLRVHRGRTRPQGRDPFGFHDGVSNLQDLRRRDPARYAGRLLHREADLEIEGSLLVFRRYRVFPEHLTDPLVVTDTRGDPVRVFRPEQVVGRCRACGAVLDAATGAHLARQPDERQGAAAHPQSHLYKANPRGRGHTNFGHAVRPPEVRMLRRGYPASDPEGLLFLAFQADIRDGGFEFIHNEWLLSDFNGAPDPLLAPESGLVEPLTGAYYFIPKQQRDVATVFRTLVTSEPAGWPAALPEPE